MTCHVPLARPSMVRRARLVRVLCGLAMAALAVVSAPAGAAAQAVYGSLSGSVTDNSGGALPGVTVTITSLERNIVDTVVANESGIYAKDRLLPGTYEVKAELAGFKTAVVPTSHGQRRHADAGQLQARSRRGDRGGDGQRRRAAAQDRPRRRGDALRRQRADRAAGARSQLHQVHPADAGRAADGLAARRVGEPARLDADADQRPALQRHRLSARRHREPRPDPRHHRRQPDARVDWREQDHLAELRRRVRPGDGRRGLGADQVGDERRSTAAPSSSSRTRRCRRATRSAQARVDPLTGKFIPDTKKNQFGGSVGGPIVQNKWFFFGDYQGTRQDQGGSRLMSVPTDAGARRQLQRVRPGHLRPGHRRGVPERDHSGRRGSRRRPARSSTSSRGRTRRARTTARATTTRPRASRSSRRTRSTPASTAGCPTR